MPAPQQSTVERFRALFMAQLAWMWTTLRRLGVKEPDLEDVAHEVFLQVYKKFETYDPARPIRPWLFAFAYREASDYRRQARHRREEATDHLPERIEPGQTTDEMMERFEESMLVQKALSRIDLDRRAVLVAFEIDGTPMKEIADAIGIPLNTAYSRLRIGREELTAEIKRLRARAGYGVRSRGEA